MEEAIFQLLEQLLKWLIHHGMGEHWGTRIMGVFDLIRAKVLSADWDLPQYDYKIDWILNKRADAALGSSVLAECHLGKAWG